MSLMLKNAGNADMILSRNWNGRRETVYVCRSVDIEWTILTQCPGMQYRIPLIEKTYVFEILNHSSDWSSATTNGP